jgi:hypothetical protein
MCYIHTFIFSKQDVPLPAIPGPVAASDATASDVATELLYEDIGDRNRLPSTEAPARMSPTDNVSMNNPYEYMKPVVGASESGGNYQFTLCSAYGVPLEAGNKL